jgi:hypothetical protein
MAYERQINEDGIAFVCSTIQVSNPDPTSRQCRNQSVPKKLTVVRIPLMADPDHACGEWIFIRRTQCAECIVSAAAFRLARGFVLHRLLRHDPYRGGPVAYRCRGAHASGVWAVGGRRKVHFQAPPAEALVAETDRFLAWANAETGEAKPRSWKLVTGNLS